RRAGGGCRRTAAFATARNTVAPQRAHPGRCAAPLDPARRRRARSVDGAMPGAPPHRAWCGPRVTSRTHGCRSRRPDGRRRRRHRARRVDARGSLVSTRTHRWRRGDDFPIRDAELLDAMVDAKMPRVLLGEGDRPDAFEAPRVAIVGTRAATPMGVADARE